MMTVNKVILIGNLGADPELRQSQSGLAICNMRLASSEREKKDGEWQDHTEWHRVVCFGNTAENVAKFCQKGKSLYIEGKIRTSKWQDKTGADRWSTEVIAHEIKFLGGRSDGQQGGGRGSNYGVSGGGQQGGGGHAGGNGGGHDNGGGDDDIPF